MNRQTTSLNLGGVKITWLLLALAGLLAAGGYGWRIYSLFREWQINVPQPQLEKLVNDLRLYHAREQQFPASFTEINALLWHTQPAPNYGQAGRQARVKHYYYFYTRVNEHTCGIWALPIGSRRQDAASFFVVLTPAWLRSWRGKALEDEVIRQLPAIPKPDQLAALSLQEMPARVFSQLKPRSVWP